MENSIYLKLQKIREGLRRSNWSNFSELITLVERKAKYHKAMVIYTFFDKVATLTILDMDNIAMCINFQLPADLTNMKNVRYELYKMAFGLGEPTDSLTAFDLAFMLERMREKGVTVEAFLERYKIKSLTEVNADIYSRCMATLNQLK